MKHLACLLAMAGIAGAFGAMAPAATGADVAKLTCADFMAMTAEDQRAVLKSLSDPRSGNVAPAKPQATGRTDDEAAAPEAGEAGSASDMPDLSESAIEDEVAAVLIACEGYEAAFVADRMTL